MNLIGPKSHKKLSQPQISQTLTPASTLVPARTLPNSNSNSDVNPTLVGAELHLICFCMVELLTDNLATSRAKNSCHVWVSDQDVVTENQLLGHCSVGCQDRKIMYKILLVMAKNFHVVVLPEYVFIYFFYILHKTKIWILVQQKKPRSCWGLGERVGFHTFHITGY